METKNYLVIARKYRPRTFDEVAGQDPVARTLKNAVALGRVGHAYLFTGPRGVGKTSMARIFAKALNCKNGPTPDPCGKCQNCLEIEGARSLDVLEVDGASNRGIDEVRALRENVKFAPAAGKFKVYIIDEVHQVTSEGFNALLKTLEEPPPHVKFIFATTSAHKVPATILSRCQRLEFKRIPIATIVETLKEICKKEKIKADDGALLAVARAADGSLRDSQSILDQIAAASDGKLNKEDVARSLGSLEDERLVEIAEAIARRDARSALLNVDELLSDGRDPSLLLESLLGHVRNLLLASVTDDLSGLVDSDDSYLKALAKQKSSFSREELFYFFAVVSHAMQTMKRFDMKRVPLEVALVKLACRAPAQDIGAALEKLAASPRALGAAAAAPVSERAEAPAEKAPPPPTRVPSKARAAEESAADIEELPQGEIEVARPATMAEEKSPTLDAVWQPLLQALKKDKISVASYLAEGEPSRLCDGVATFSFPAALSFHRETLEGTENRMLIERHLGRLLGQAVRIQFVSVESVSRKDSSLPPDASEPAVPADAAAEKSAMNIFGGRIIR